MANKILIDSNALVVLLLGMMDPKLINKHSKTSIYDEDDYIVLSELIGSLENIVVLPNILTEADNLLNNFVGNHRYTYVAAISALIRSSSEKYLESKSVLDEHYFPVLGLTDALILTLAKDCRYIITSDSKLSDQATALGIDVFDLVKYKNVKLSQ